eukprot:m.464864 g.464864  ORF g.464864 m.464864 type:complete len:75 (+) comp23811_c0_seq1:59-283(+)
MFGNQRGYTRSGVVVSRDTGVESAEYPRWRRWRKPINAAPITATPQSPTLIATVEDLVDKVLAETMRLLFLAFL